MPKLRANFFSAKNINRPAARAQKLSLVRRSTKAPRARFLAPAPKPEEYSSSGDSAARDHKSNASFVRLFPRLAVRNSARGRPGGSGSLSGIAAAAAALLLFESSSGDIFLPELFVPASESAADGLLLRARAFRLDCRCILFLARFYWGSLGLSD